jgi:S-DNA-T family DNA segregation ATPase FtsK/SpoIIIE
MPEMRTRLMLFAMAAPLFAQAMMVIVMLVQGQWLFAMMIVPGAIGCLASILVALPWGHSPQPASAQPFPNEAGKAGRACGAIDDDTADGTTGFNGIEPQAIETLLALDRLPWRTIVARWIGACERNDLDVPLGTSQAGPFMLDLNRQGPHALVAGTTGSGKSVLLQSWCLALASANGPDRLAFVFLDFKGGSAFRELERLPHTVGSVCDLDLAHAARALRALEMELTRRERLVAAHHASHIGDLRAPPPRLIVVIDEFHALKDQLPDYINRLVRIASLGRSLGMHLIACTQNPLGQVNADMKANMAVSICLRVRDGLQSTELLGDGRAAAISPTLPGAAYCNDSAQVSALRCAPVGDVAAFCLQIVLAARFTGTVPLPPLFTAPLPSVVRDHTAASRSSDRIRFGLADDGIALSDATVAMDAGNIGIIGPQGCGKTTLLAVLARHAQEAHGLAVRISEFRQGAWHMEYMHRLRQEPVLDGEAPEPPHMVWLVDDADELFDPFHGDQWATQFREALADPAISVVFAVQSARHVRVPEHCGIRIVFPCGERTADLVAGIPSDIVNAIGQHDLDTPGRAVLIEGVTAYLVQCAS